MSNQNISSEFTNGFSEEHHGTPLNKSYDSQYSSTSNPTSSKAVLAALRALQDKIRRLETERGQAIDETAQLRHQLKNQEIEAEHVKQRELLSTQKNLNEARHSYDRLLSEKTEIEIRVSKLEDRNRISQATADELQTKIRGLEDEKQNGLFKIKEFESQHLQLQAQLENAQAREKEIAQNMIFETKRHEEELYTLGQRTESLQIDLANLCDDKAASDNKLHELDQLIGQLLSVNEALVAQLSGKSLQSIVSKSKLIKKRPSSAPKKSVVPNVATHSTVSFNESRASKYDTRRQNQMVPVRTDEIQQLQALHKMYKNKVSDLTGDKKKKIIKKATNNTELMVKTGGVKHTTRLGKKKNDLKNKSEETNYIKIPTQTVSFDSLLKSTENNSPVIEFKKSPVKDYDLQGVIASLESEFDSLNRQYRLLLSDVQSNSDRAPEADELVEVIQKLHKKGEQLRNLKSPIKKI